MGKVLKTELRKLYGKAGERLSEVPACGTAIRPPCRRWSSAPSRCGATCTSTPSFRRRSTARRRVILERLRALGLDDVRACADTGATAIVRGAKPGPNLLWRADIDGLPLMEETGLPFASREKAMHACGHDGHVAIALAMAEVLQRSRDVARGHGALRVPAGGGARRRRAADDRRRRDGRRRRWTGRSGCTSGRRSPVGEVRVTAGPIFAAATHFRIIIRGRGGHASAPHQTVDPIVVAAQAIVALQTVVSRSVDPEQTAVFTIGRIEGGVRGNIIPNEVMMSGTIRTFEAAVLKRVLERVDEILRGVTSAFGAEYQFDTSTLRAVVNDAECAALVDGGGGGAARAGARRRGADDGRRRHGVLPGGGAGRVLHAGRRQRGARDHVAAPPPKVRLRRGVPADRHRAGAADHRRGFGSASFASRGGADTQVRPYDASVR